MSDSTYNVVCTTLASYFEVHVSQIRPDQQLRRDWGLDSLELYIIGQRIEQAENVQIRSTDLAAVHTVGQLILLVRAIRRRTELTEEVTAVRSRHGADQRPIERRHAPASRAMEPSQAEPPAALRCVK
jgi:acyl carrier protein